MMRSRRGRWRMAWQPPSSGHGRIVVRVLEARERVGGGRAPRPPPLPARPRRVLWLPSDGVLSPGSAA